MEQLGEHFHTLAWMIPAYKNNTESCYLCTFGGSLDQALGIYPCSLRDLLDANDCFIVFSFTCCLVIVTETWFSGVTEDIHGHDFIWDQSNFICWYWLLSHAFSFETTLTIVEGEAADAEVEIYENDVIKIM